MRSIRRFAPALLIIIGFTLGFTVTLFSRPFVLEGPLDDIKRTAEQEVFAGRPTKKVRGWIVGSNQLSWLSISEANAPTVLPVGVHMPDLLISTKSLVGSQLQLPFDSSGRYPPIVFVSPKLENIFLSLLASRTFRMAHLRS